MYTNGRKDGPVIDIISPTPPSQLPCAVFNELRELVHKNMRVSLNDIRNPTTPAVKCEAPTKENPKDARDDLARLQYLHDRSFPIEYPEEFYHNNLLKGSDCGRWLMKEGYSLLMQEESIKRKRNHRYTSPTTSDDSAATNMYNNTISLTDQIGNLLYSRRHSCLRGPSSAQRGPIAETDTYHVPRDPSLQSVATSQFPSPLEGSDIHTKHKIGLREEVDKVLRSVAEKEEQRMQGANGHDNTRAPSLKQNCPWIVALVEIPESLVREIEEVYAQYYIPLEGGTGAPSPSLSSGSGTSTCTVTTPTDNYSLQQQHSKIGVNVKLKKEKDSIQVVGSSSCLSREKPVDDTFMLISETSMIISSDLSHKEKCSIGTRTSQKSHSNNKDDNNMEYKEHKCVQKERVENAEENMVIVGFITGTFRTIKYPSSQVKISDNNDNCCCCGKDQGNKDNKHKEDTKVHAERKICNGSKKRATREGLVQTKTCCQAASLFKTLTSTVRDCTSSYIRRCCSCHYGSMYDSSKIPTQVGYISTIGVDPFLKRYGIGTVLLNAFKGGSQALIKGMVAVEMAVGSGAVLCRPSSRESQYIIPSPSSELNNRENSYVGDDKLYNSLHPYCDDSDSNDSDSDDGGLCRSSVLATGQVKTMISGSWMRFMEGYLYDHRREVMMLARKRDVDVLGLGDQWEGSGVGSNTSTSNSNNNFNVVTNDHHNITQVYLARHFAPRSCWDRLYIWMRSCGPVTFVVRLACGVAFKLLLLIGDYGNVQQTKRNKGSGCRRSNRDMSHASMESFVQKHVCVKEIWLHVLASNTDALRFYINNNFVKRQFLFNYYYFRGSHHHAVLLSAVAEPSMDVCYSNEYISPASCTIFRTVNDSSKLTQCPPASPSERMLIKPYAYNTATHDSYCGSSFSSTLKETPTPKKDNYRDLYHYNTNNVKDNTNKKYISSRNNNNNNNINNEDMFSVGNSYNDYLLQVSTQLEHLGGEHDDNMTYWVICGAATVVWLGVLSISSVMIYSSL